MTIEKVYDELYGMIEDLKKQIAAGGGGDDVTITPALESGAKIADFTIGADEGTLYAPASIMPVWYSESEREEGVWIDGSKIYSKCTTIAYSEFTVDNSTFAHVSLSALYPADVNKKLFIEGVVNTPSHGVVQIGKPAYISTNKSEYILAGSYYTGALALTVVSADNTLLTISPTNAIVKVYYTKTPPTEAKKTTKKK